MKGKHQKSAENHQKHEKMRFSVIKSSLRHPRRRNFTAGTKIHSPIRFAFSTFRSSKPMTQNFYFLYFLRSAALPQQISNNWMEMIRKCGNHEKMMFSVIKNSLRQLRSWKNHIWRFPVSGCNEPLKLFSRKRADNEISIFFPEFLQHLHSVV